MKVTRAEKRRQARAERKALKKQIPISEPSTYGIWEYKGGHHQETPREPDVPGVNCRPLDPEHDAMVKANKWFDHDKFEEWTKTITRLSGNEDHDEDKWSWSRNWDCKYVDIRIDMRDGGFIVRDQNGERISMEQLKWQYQFKKDRPDVQV